MNPQGIFGPYDNGAGKAFHADPFDVDLALREACQDDPGNVQRQTRDKDPAVSIPAKRKLVAAVRVAFKLAPFDPATGAGATAEHALTIWNAWADYCSKKNGKPASPPISQPPDSVPDPTTGSPSANASAYGFTAPA